MKKVLRIGIVLLLVLISCESEVEIPLESNISESDVPLNATFLNTQVVAAYGILDGNLDNSDVWRAAPSNWVYGEVASDNAYKGSEAGDQTVITTIETYDSTPINSFVDYKWRAVWEGVARCNVAIRAVTNGIATGQIPEDDGNEFLGELRFLRGHYHFEAKKMWGKIPFIDETITASVSNESVDVWPDIEADFEFAVNHLPETPKRAGGANVWNASVYLGKIHMYQLDYVAAKPLLDEVINNGPYSLNTNFHDNFNADTNNSSESVFAVQYAVNDGSANSSNGNYGDILNFPNNSPINGCCGFFQPSHNLVNAYKTDVNGLPLFDTYDNADIANVDPNSAETLPDDDSFVPDTANLDPRLDWTVGRKGIPFLGWGDFPGLVWIRDPDNGGSYVGKKTVYSADQDGDVTTSTGWAPGVNAINTNIIRYAEVLLWRAEIAASESDLTNAMTLVDMVRARAANPATFVKRENGSNAANYVIGLYADNGGFPSQQYAEEAVLFEYRLETALEGHRFFDLVRREKATEVLNDYLSDEIQRTYLVGKTFVANDEVFPIPSAAIDLSGNVLQQNEGY